jgi:hypothetical protein
MDPTKYTLRWMAEAGYIMGLSTIGEVVGHMHSHYDAYFLIADLESQMAQFEQTWSGHENESIDLHLTAEDKARIDEEMERALSADSSTN